MNATLSPDAKGIEFFELVDRLNRAAPAHLLFLTAYYKGYYGKDIVILLHGKDVGEITVRDASSYDKNKQGYKTFKFQVNVGSQMIYSSREYNDKDNWKLSTKGLITKMIVVVEDLIDQSRVNLSNQWHTKKWGEITNRDLNELLDTKVGEKVSASFKKFEHSALLFSAAVPGFTNRKKFPRVYTYTLNGKHMFGGRAVPITDPKLNAAVKEIKRFEVKLKGVLEDA